jgi:deoxyuridine 5'-triphosphate nucleotidohydrolase
MNKLTDYLNNLSILNHTFFQNNNFYLLGYLSNLGYVSCKYNKLKIILPKTSFYILDLFKYQLNSELYLIELFDTHYKIWISSEDIINNYLKFFNITKGKNFHLININNFINKIEFYTFLNGYIDYNCNLLLINNTPELIINFRSTKLLKLIKNNISIPNNRINNNLVFSSTNCIDLLGEIYKYNQFYNFEIYNKFQNYINWKFIHLTSLNSYKLDKCKFYKDDENAIIPSKHYESDVGYDLTIIKKIKNLTPSTELFDTGIKVSVDYGYYIEIVPRSSLSKSGYILANSIGIIEKTYSGNLLVALTKIDKDMPDITLPFRCCQLLFKPQISLELISPDNNNIFNSSRGSGGFGSSNN